VLSAASAALTAAVAVRICVSTSLGALCRENFCVDAGLLLRRVDRADRFTERARRRSVEAVVQRLGSRESRRPLLDQHILADREGAGGGRRRRHAGEALEETLDAVALNLSALVTHGVGKVEGALDRRDVRQVDQVGWPPSSPLRMAGTLFISTLNVHPRAIRPEVDVVEGHEEFVNVDDHARASADD